MTSMMSKMTATARASKKQLDEYEEVGLRLCDHCRRPIPHPTALAL